MDTRLNAPTSSTRIVRVPAVGRVSGCTADVDVVISGGRARDCTPGAPSAVMLRPVGRVCTAARLGKATRVDAHLRDDARSRASGGGDAYGRLALGRVPTVGRVPTAGRVLTIGGASTVGCVRTGGRVHTVGRVLAV